ncbi:MAG: hypothetical protein JKY03_02845 [Aureispira sp.]|nr:hypothetical protein [Aureispira sp.]
MKLELSHDTLAKAIYDKASREDKMLIKKQNFINRRYKYYIASRVLLDRKDLNRVIPHLHKLTLDQEVLSFVRKSENYANRRQFLIGGTAFLVSLTLLIFGIQAVGTFYELQVNIKNKKAVGIRLEKTKKQRAIAENKAQRLLDGTAGAMSQEDLQNINVVKQMIIKYDTLGREQTIIIEQRDLAQSATLSDLAATALEQNDKAYALQLASKAWELNPDNTQSLEILEKVNKQKAIAFSDFSSNKQADLVQESQKKTGKLEEQDLEAIFSKENEVGQNHALGIKRSVTSKKVSLRATAPSAAIKIPDLYKVIQQNKPKTPILQAVKESLKPERLDRKLDCFLAQRDVDRWLPVEENKTWSLFVKYASDGKLYLQIILNTREAEGVLPNFTQLKFSSSSVVKVVRLSTKSNLKEENIYIVELNEADKDWLKDTRILGFSFTIEELGSNKYEVFERAFFLDKKVQNQLITMGKCLL